MRGDDAVHLAAALFVGADAITTADRDLGTAAIDRGFHVALPID